MQWRAWLIALSLPTTLCLAVSRSEADVTAVSACSESQFDAALADGGTVSFSCSGTISVTTEKVIVGHVVIDGFGQSVTLDGGGSIALFRVQFGSSLTLRNLTLTRGRQPGGGGAVHVVPGGQFEAWRVTFKDNVGPYGGAVANSGITRIVASEFRGNRSDGAVSNYSGSGGGAITNEAGANLTVETSIFAGNSAPLLFEREPNIRPSAGQGGAIQNRGTATIVRSTFTGNSAFDGGAIYNGAVVPGDGMLTVVNSTLAGDIAEFGGAELYNGATVRIVNSTIVGRPDSPAIAHYPFLFKPEFVLHLTNTILAVRGCVSNSGDHMVDGGGNLVAGAAGHGCGLPVVADPNLGPLQDNGGGVPTMAITRASSAFQHGVEAACGASGLHQPGGLDQRGFPRFTCSSGAFEPRADPTSLHVRYLPLVAVN